MSHAGYYCVHIRQNGVASTHTVFAVSDYDAAIKVKKITGIMAQSDDDVRMIPTAFFMSPLAATGYAGDRSRVAGG